MLINVVHNDSQQLTLEHIMPKSINPIDFSNGYPNFNEAEHKVYKNWIGNQTLLTANDNIDAGNAPFDEKQIVYSKSILEINQNLSNLDKWSIAELKDRQNKFAEIAVKAWVV